MAWMYLLAAGGLEVVWASLMKRAFTQEHLITAIVVAAMAGSFVFLRMALQTLPIGTAYAVWTGIGAVGAALVGMALMGESASLARIGCIALIVIGVAGLKLIG